MKQQVLKALANPALLFYVPYSLAVINFAVQFIIYMILFIGSLIVSKGTNPISPLFFLLSVIGVPDFLNSFWLRAVTLLT